MIENPNGETCLLCFSFIRPLALMVNPRKVGDNDRYWQGNHQYTAQGTDSSHDLTRRSVRYHVPVPAIEKEIRNFSRT